MTSDPAAPSDNVADIPSDNSSGDSPSTLTHGETASEGTDIFRELSRSDKDPEVVIGLVAAMGTDLKLVRTLLEASLRRFSYEVRAIKLSEEMCSVTGFGPYPKDVSEDERYLTLMKEGTRFRQELGEDALARLGVMAIRSMRMSITGSAMRPAARIAYVLHSLKHPSEVKALRRTYGRRFILLAAYASREQRVSDLARTIADSLHTAQVADQRGRAERLILRDELERDEDQRYPVSRGQKVTDVFPMADAFVDARDKKRLTESINRTVELLFASDFHTPSRDEQGMFFAQAAALRSSSLARQVGAALTTRDGDLIATGVNEVPKAGGGSYWEGDSPDDRDYAWGKDISDEYRRHLAADALNLLKERGWLSEEISQRPIDSLVNEALIDNAAEPGPLSQARLMDVMEFVRAVHAEMAVLIDAARRGVRTQDGTLYVTTFPCHECARLLVAAGIARVVYVEPYPKSQAVQLYPSAINVEAEAACGERVPFVPFIGIAPRRYADFFVAREERKNRRTGTVAVTVPATARPRVPGPYSLHIMAEVFEAASLERTLQNRVTRPR